MTRLIRFPLLYSVLTFPTFLLWLAATRKSTFQYAISDLKRAWLYHYFVARVVGGIQR
jgi:hypothetical protein